MNRLLSLMAVVSIFAFAVIAANAAPKNTWPKWKYTPVEAMPSEDTLVSYTQAEHEASIEAAKNYKVRTVANAADGSGMSEELANLTAFINGLGFEAKGRKMARTELYKEAIKLYKRLYEIRTDKDINSKPNDYKFAVAHIVPLASYRSVVWRMIPVVEPAQALRQSLVDTIQDTYGDLKLYFPDSEWEVGFSFLTEPFEGSEPQFKDESEVQKFMLDRIANDAAWAVKVLGSVNIPADKPATFDNRIIYGKMAFTKDVEANRFTWVRQYDVWAAIGRLERQLYSIYMNGVYNIKHSARLAAEIAAMYGIEVGKSSVACRTLKRCNLQVPTRKDRIDIVMNDDFNESFKKNPLASTYITKAITHLKKSVSKSQSAWIALKASNETANALLDPNFFKGRASETEKGFANANGILSGAQKTVTSVITGKTIKINFVEFLTSHLPDDSKKMLPTAFNDEEPRTLPRAGFPKGYRNYSWGRATEWDSAIYSKLFPELAEINDRKMADAAVKDYMRTFTESRGGSILADFLVGYVR